MKTIRKRIIDYLQRNYRATVSELASTLGVTKPTIHYHVKHLLDAHIISKLGSSQPSTEKTRGRPAVHYQINDEHRANNYEVLTRVLLTMVRKRSSAADLNATIVADMAELLFPKIGNTENNLINKLQSAVLQLERLNYEPHWEIKQDGPVISLRNCPYASILKDHPEMCRMDKYVLERLTDRTVFQTAYIFNDSPGVPACIFTLQPE